MKKIFEKRMTFAKIAAAALVGASVMSTQLMAQDVAAPGGRNTPPPPAEPKGFTLPAVTKFTLDNGLQVTMVPYGNVPKAAVRAVVRTGNIDDGTEYYIADFLGAIMEEGANGQTAAQMSERAAQMGGNLNVGVGLDQTFVTMDVLSESVPDAIGMIADVLQRPDFPVDSMEKVRANLMRQLSVGASQPGTIADHAYGTHLYPDHPYGITIPDTTGVENFVRGDIITHHTHNFGAMRTHIYVVGRFDEAATRAKIEEAFGGWAGGRPASNIPATDAKAPAVLLVDRPGAVQSTIRLGKRVPALSDDLSLEAADTILGGAFFSRITQNIREDKGYTYSPGSFVDTEYKAADWQQNADITTNVTGPAIAEVVKEIKRLQAETPTAEETTGIKNYMNGIFVLQLASRGGLANQLSNVDLHELGDDYLSSYNSRVQALTPSDLQNAANEHLKVDEMTLAVVGDLKEVRPQLEALEDFKGKLPADEGAEVSE